MAKKPLEGQTTADPQVVRANVNRSVVPAENFVSLYANDTQVQFTPWDVRLILGVVTGVPTAENPMVTVTQIGEVRMSPQHVKKVVAILQAQIDHYEKTIGPIFIPED
jgi:hypothetical protein